MGGPAVNRPAFFVCVEVAAPSSTPRLLPCQEVADESNREKDGKSEPGIYESGHTSVAAAEEDGGGENHLIVTCAAAHPQNVECSCDVAVAIRATEHAMDVVEILVVCPRDRCVPGLAIARSKLDEACRRAEHHAPWVARCNGPTSPVVQSSCRISDAQVPHKRKHPCNRVDGRPEDGARPRALEPARFGSFIRDDVDRMQVVHYLLGANNNNNILFRPVFI